MPITCIAAKIHLQICTAMHNLPPEMWNDLGHFMYNVTKPWNGDTSLIETHVLVSRCLELYRTVPLDSRV